VLDKGDIGRSEKVEMHLVISADSIDSFLAKAVIPFVPRSRGEGVGVAEQDSISSSGRLVLASLLFHGDVDKLLVTPTGRWVVYRQALYLALPVFAAILRNP